MRLEHAEENLDIVGRLRNFEATFVMLLVRRGGSVLWRIRKRDPRVNFS
jgi:hypothetical protein